MNNYVLHGIALSGPAYKVALMLSMTNLPFDFKLVNLRTGAHKTPEFIALNRFGQVPALEDKAAGFAVCQSGAILEYLAAKTRKFGGSNPQNKAQVREWLFWSFDKLVPPIYRLRAMRLGFRSFNQATAEMYNTEGLMALDTLNKQLEGKKWLVGNRMTIADIEVYGVVSFAHQGGFDMKAFPNIGKFMKSFEKQKGFKTAAELMPM